MMVMSKRWQEGTLTFGAFTFRIGLGTKQMGSHVGSEVLDALVFCTVKLSRMYPAGVYRLHA